MEQDRRSGRLIAGLGSAQLLAWGALYYAIAVIAEPMRLELGLSRSHVFGAFAWSVLVSGVLAPWAGRRLDRHGGRAVLVVGAIAGALGFTILAHAQSFGGLVVAWSLNGVAMAFGLYDTCFAAVGQVAPGAYRPVLTGVTLIAGFASTVSWPLSHHLLHAIGWRGVCEVYSAGLLACAPLYLATLPAFRPSTAGRPAQPAVAHVPSHVNHAMGGRARVLAWAFAGAASIGAVISAHLVGILQALALPADRALWLASSIGVLQVLGRAIELLFGARHTPTRIGLFTFVGLFAATGLLLAASVQPSFAFGFALLYGVANGVLTIAKATLPVEMFGTREIGALLGTFGAPSLFARALAPLGYAMLASSAGTFGALSAMAMVALAALAAYVFATAPHAAKTYGTTSAASAPPRARSRRYDQLTDLRKRRRRYRCWCRCTGPTRRRRSCHAQERS
ncbi:MAG TPA: MFS transporter, partial [Polyangiales bacterium]|nr:MFS transporter [Polyangiales bacterium]